MDGLTSTTARAAFTRRMVDRKRLLWSLSVLMPLLPLVGIVMAELSGWRVFLWLPFAVIYGLIPALDALIGTDNSNPPESAVARLEADAYYRRLTYLAVALHLLSLVAGMGYAVTATQGLLEPLAVVLSLGFVAALAINTGHELGHKNTRLERRLSQLALAVAGYGHFRIEHNLGHHAAVATPEDCASSRMGESIYRFVWRELPGGVRRGWRLEAQRLARLGLPAWSPRNDILQSWAMTLLLQGSLVAWLGWQALPWLLLHNLWAWFMVTGVNYIEHYGLLRRRGADGRYERCQPRHSWNSNHVISNLLLFHLQRHSDHHAHAERRYQSLRHFDEAPQLPTGYMGMLLLSYCPTLYFRVMDPRLLAQVDGDLGQVNRGPRR